MSNDQDTSAIEALDDAWRVLYAAGARVPPAEVVVAADVTYGSMGVPVPPLNNVFAARFGREDAGQRIDEVVAWYRARDVPLLWWVSPADRPADLAELLVAHGFVEESETAPGMVADLTALPAEPPPVGIDIELVRDARALAEACEVLVAGFGLPAVAGEALARLGALGFGADVPLHTFIARMGGKAVGTSLGVVAGRSIAVFNVATLSEARGRGVGRAVTLAAMRDGAEHGAEIALLQSSAMGHPVYERLGFRDFADYRIFLRP